jgi:hypothetical protein
MHSISGRSLHISFHFGCEPFFTKFEMLYAIHDVLA